MSKFCTLILAAFAVALPIFVTGQVVLPGDCPKYSTQASFNPAQVNASFSNFSLVDVFRVSRVRIIFIFMYCISSSILLCSLLLHVGTRLVDIPPLLKKTQNARWLKLNLQNKELSKWVSKELAPRKFSSRTTFISKGDTFSNLIFYTAMVVQQLRQAMLILTTENWASFWSKCPSPIGTVRACLYLSSLKYCNKNILNKLYLYNHNNSHQLRLTFLDHFYWLQKLCSCLELWPSLHRFPSR